MMDERGAALHGGARQGTAWWGMALQVKGKNQTTPFPGSLAEEKNEPASVVDIQYIASGCLSI
jgi:hypothetical protein